jgi:hypothetical protein
VCPWWWVLHNVLEVMLNNLLLILMGEDPIVPVPQPLDEVLR